MNKHYTALLAHKLGNRLFKTKNAGLALLTVMSMAHGLNAQINYTQNFGSNIGGWTGANGLTWVQSTGCAGASAWSNINTNTNYFISPNFQGINAVNGNIVTLTYSYKVTQQQPMGPPTAAAPNSFGSISVQWASSPAGPWTTIQSISTDHVASTACAVKTVTFGPPAGNLNIRFEITTTANYYFYFDDISIIQGSTLPVDMSKLLARTTPDHKGQLTWNTFMEQHNKGFAVQRSNDGKSFTTIDFVPSRAEHGNSQEPLAYTFTDEKVVKGTTYYRLQQTDLDDKLTFSNIVSLQEATNSKSFSLEVFPNPFQTSFRVATTNEGDGQGTLTLTDITGKVLKKISTHAGSTLVNVEFLVSGIYLLHYHNGVNDATIKINKQ